MSYEASVQRYDSAVFRTCGQSGLQLPAISLGFWHNFGGVDNFENARDMVRVAFDAGITHFDLANNYGPPPGSAEETFGQILKKDLKPYRNEMIISSKAGFRMWPGPYGFGGSRKYLLSSLDDSLLRMGLEYVDIFYHHRPDAETPLEESMSALAHAVHSGKALYVGISNYSAEDTQRAAAILKELKTPCFIHQQNYSMLNRSMEEDNLLPVLEKNGIGCIVFSPLGQGLLTDRYLDGIPADSRAGKEKTFLKRERITESLMVKIRKLNSIAEARGQSLAQLAVAWILRYQQVTSVLVGASRVEQIQNNLHALTNLGLADDELSEIDTILQS